MSVHQKMLPGKLPLALVPQYFGSLVFDHRTSKYLPFDEEATEILKRLKNDPFNEILAQCQNEEYKNQLTRFFERFYKLGFFTVDLRFSGTILDIVPPEDHLAGPLALHLEVAAACNLKCTHCFAGELPRKESPLGLNEIDGLFDSLKRMGTFRIGLTGGEPLLRKDLFDIIDLATSHSLHPCVTTNGLLITEDIAREFAKRELVWLNVSLEGATVDTNDLVRGKGTFQRVLERLSVLSMHSRFTLAFTIMKSNLHEMKACAELAYKLGAHTAVFRPLYPVGVARHHLELMPTFEEYHQALNELAGLQYHNEFELCNIDPFSPAAREESQSNIYDNYGCGAGNTVCSVSLSGDVNPCSFLGNDFVASNIRNQQFEEIWHSSQQFREMRDGSEDNFNGGCRARSLVLNGSAYAPDPWVNANADFHPQTILEVSARNSDQG